MFYLKTETNNHNGVSDDTADNTNYLYINYLMRMQHQHLYK